MEDKPRIGRKIALGAGLLFGAGWLMSTAEERAAAKRRVDPIGKVLFAFAMLALLWIALR